MVTLILFVLIAILVVLYRSQARTKKIIEILAFFEFVIIAFVIFECILILSIFFTDTSSSKLNMYIAENNKIEQNVKVAVETYARLENENLAGMLTTVNPESYITILSSFPDFKELKENLTTELDEYVANKDEIQQLEKIRITNSNLKWWVYFGH